MTHNGQQPGGERYRDGSYLTANPDSHQGDSTWKAAHVAALLELHALRPATVGEIGCGTGGVLHALASRLPETTFTGWDVSPQAIEIARGKRHDRITFHEGQPFGRDLRFDLLLILDVVEHVENYPSFLRAITSLAPCRVFHIPLDLSLQSLLRVRPLLELRRRVGHLHLFFKDTALAALEESGHRVVDYRYTPGAVERPRSRTARLMAGPRRLACRWAPDLSVRVLGGYSLLVLAR